MQSAYEWWDRRRSSRLQNRNEASVTRVRKRMLEDLQRRNYSPATTRGYIIAVDGFVGRCWHPRYFLSFPALLHGPADPDSLDRGTGVFFGSVTPRFATSGPMRVFGATMPCKHAQRKTWITGEGGLSRNPQGCVSTSREAGSSLPFSA